MRRWAVSLLGCMLVLAGCQSPQSPPNDAALAGDDDRPLTGVVVLVNCETRHLLATQNALGASGTPVVTYQRERPDPASHRWVLVEEDRNSRVYNLYSTLDEGGTKYATLVGNNTDIDIEVTPQPESDEHRRRRRWVIRHVGKSDGNDVWRVESQFNGSAMRGKNPGARVICEPYENDTDMHWFILRPTD